MRYMNAMFRWLCGIDRCTRSLGSSDATQSEALADGRLSASAPSQALPLRHRFRPGVFVGAPTLARSGPSIAPRQQEHAMLHYALVFFVIALIAAVLGFGGLAASAAGIAKVLFIVFIVLAIASFLFGLIRGS
jgi:uncharacterized membrane protein YtjA (UPF0391 family)